MGVTWGHVTTTLAVLLHLPRLATSVACESYYEPFAAHDNCLYLGWGPVTWDLAHENCAAYGNTLLNMDSQATAIELRQLLAAKRPSVTEIWTGLNDQWREGEFRWSRGEALQGGGVVAGGLSHAARSRNCVMARQTHGAWGWSWSDQTCQSGFLHVCENWPNDKRLRGAVFSLQHNVTEASMNLVMKKEIQGSFRFCRQACLDSAYVASPIPGSVIFCEVLAVNKAKGRCRFLFFKERILTQRQSLLSQLVSYKIYLRTHFHKHY